MILKEKERTVIEDLQTQEKSCIEKYRKIRSAGKDPWNSEHFSRIFSRKKENIMILCPWFCQELFLNVTVMIHPAEIISQKRPILL